MNVEPRSLLTKISWLVNLKGICVEFCLCVQNASVRKVKMLSFLGLYLLLCVCVCVGGGAGGHDQSISPIMRSEGCHYGSPSGVQRLLFRKEHRCLLSSKQTRTSLTFRANTTLTRRHLLFPNMLFALMIRQINHFFPLSLEQIL